MNITRIVRNVRVVRIVLTVLIVLIVRAPGVIRGQGRGELSRFEADTLQHFQALVRLDTSNPPGNERIAADYLVAAFKAAGIDVQTFARAPNRMNVVVRLKGNGRKRPLLLMGHTDVVTVDPAKWKTHGPFSADREGGYIYGRGTVDNKSSVVAGLMTLLELKRRKVPLDRDVIFLAEAGEEGTQQFGMEFMANEHFADVDAEYCLAEGGGVSRKGGKVVSAGVQTMEKHARTIVLTARGTSGHASVPLQTNAIVHLGAALEKIAAVVPPISLSETTRAYFTRLATLSSPAEARRYRDVLDPSKAQAIERYFRANEPEVAAILHTTISPTMIEGGYRFNVIPSEAKATLDVRILPDENPEMILGLVRHAVNDRAVTVEWAPRTLRPIGSSRIDTEAFKVLEEQVTKHYSTTTLPLLGTGATDMAYMRAKGAQCYGIGPATDDEDAPRGYGAHSDLERILENELQRFVRFQYDVVVELAKAK
jgi:acetylornithine deacetylase/succinyl-diaminopimelate desuccinylase-like protein